MVGTGRLKPFLKEVDKDIKKEDGTFKRSFRKEVREYLKKRDRPITKRNIKRAKKKLRTRKAKALVPAGKEITGIESDAPRDIIYGDAVVGGIITCMHVTNNNQNLNLIISIAGHEIESVDELYLDDTRIIFGGTPLLPDPRWASGSQKLNRAPKTGDNAPFRNKVFMATNLGTQAQPAISDAISEMPGVWTVDHRQAGVAHVYLILVYDGLIFAEGIPDISFKIKGKKLFDPRSSTSYFTSNAALAINDLLTNFPYGLAIPANEVNQASLIDAANICDQLLPRTPTVGNAFTQEPRYEIKGTYTADLSPGEVLEEMVTSIGGGQVSYNSGEFRITPGFPRTPVLELTEDDVRSSLSVVSKVSRRDSFNAIRGTFVSEDNNYEVTEFPAAREQFFIDRDGEQIFEDVSYPFTTSTSQVQRLAKIDIRRNRQEVHVSGTFSLKAYELEVGDTVEFTFERLGFNRKLFEVNEVHFTSEGVSEGNGIANNIFLSLQETAPEVYDVLENDIITEDPTPNSELPDPFTVGVPQNLQAFSGTNELFLRGDGTVFSRIRVTWDPFNDAFVSDGGNIEVSYKLSTEPDSAYTYLTRVPAQNTFTYILEVKDGLAYDIRARGQNGLGVYSDYAIVSGHIVIGKTAPPSDVTGLAASFTQFGIDVEWNQILDLDLDYYILKLGIPGDTFDTARQIAEVSANTYTLKTQASGTYVFFLKAVDTTGNVSLNASQITIEIVGPAAPKGFTFSLDGPDYILSWLPVRSDIFQVEQYVLSYGATFETAVELSEIKGTTFRQKVTWGQERTFYLYAQDVANNRGAFVSLDVFIDPPSRVRSLRAEIVDNFVLLRWLAPQFGSLPIEQYEVRRSDVDDFDTAEIVGFVTGTFSTIFEIISGTYFYWVRAKDTANSSGNFGPPTQVIAIVDEPPDFKIFDDQFLDLSLADELINMTYIDNGVEQYLLGPIQTDITWRRAYTDFGFNTPQDRIDAGFPIYGQPNAQWGYFERTVDYGVIIPPTLIKVSLLREILAGNPDVITTIGYSTDNVTFIETKNTFQIFAGNFRYIRIKVMIGCPPGTVAGQTTGGLLLGLTYDGSALP